MNINNNSNMNEPLMMDEKIHIEKYWKIIKPRLHIVIIITLFLVAAAYVKVSTRTPIYQATGLLMIEPEKNIVMFDNRPTFMGTGMSILIPRSKYSRAVPWLNL